MGMMRMGPCRGRAQNRDEEHQLGSDGKAVEGGPVAGLPDRVEHRDGNVQRCDGAVDGTVHPSRKRD